MAAGLILATLADESGQVIRSGRVVLGVAAVTLLVPAWLAAWNGTRALWGHYFDSREAMVSTESLSERYSYFRGMRVTRVAYESMEAFERRRGQLEQEGKLADGFYFINGSEWMMRAFPSVRLRGLPLWLHEGTTYGEAGARAIQQKLASAPEIGGVVSFGGWNFWRHGMEWYLLARYQYERAGPGFHLHLLRDEAREVWTAPLVFSARTGSTADARDLVESGGPFVLRPSERGLFVGTPRSGRIEIKAPLNGLHGELVVRRTPVAGESTIRMIWRVVGIGAGGEETVLREEIIDVAGDEPERALAFEFSPEGRSVALDVFLPPDERLEAGFRRLHTDYAMSEEPAFPAWLDSSLEVQPKSETWGEALFASSELSSTPIRGAGLAVSPLETESGRELFAHTPSEVWFRLKPGFRRLRGEFGVGPATWKEAGALPGAVAWVVFHRPGHVQVLLHKELRPRLVETDRMPQSFDVAVPEDGGWVGLIFQSLVPGRNAYGHSWWRKIEARSVSRTSSGTGKQEGGRP